MYKHQDLVSNQTNMSMLHPLDVVGPGIKTFLQVTENVN